MCRFKGQGPESKQLLYKRSGKCHDGRTCLWLELHVVAASTQNLVEHGYVGCNVVVLNGRIEYLKFSKNAIKALNSYNLITHVLSYLLHP